MRRIFVAAAVLAMSLPGAAVAQARHEGQQDQVRKPERAHRSRVEDVHPIFMFQGRPYAAVQGPEFHYPRGFKYRTWRRGEYLPRLFLAPPYLIEFGDLGLPPSPPDTHWVRYGPDALLADMNQGRIVDVIYAAFY